MYLPKFYSLKCVVDALNNTTFVCSFLFSVSLVTVTCASYSVIPKGALVNPTPSIQPPVTMQFSLKNILKQIPYASTSDLQKLLEATSKELDFKKLKHYVEYVPDVLDASLGDEVMQECESMNIPDSMRKASSQWLSPVNEPYIYPDGNPVHHAKDIKQFTGISKVMDILNTRFNAELDSCLVLKYSTSSASTSLHADDESTLDQKQPICNLTIGTSRTIEFVSTNGGKPVCSFNMEHRGVVLMKEGTQTVLKQMVRVNIKKKKELGYSLSFRALAK